MRKITLIFVLVSFPFFGQYKFESKIIGETEGIRLGIAVDISEDGSVLTATSGTYARVYRKNNSGVWEQLGQDILPVNIGSIYSSKISPDGRILIVGNVDSVNAYGDGIVRVFELINDNWVQIGNNIVGNTTSNTFDAIGRIVDMSSDGMVIAFSGRPGTQIYKYNNDSWEKVGNTIQSGTYLSLSSDGNIIAVNRANSNVSGVNIGKVAIYKNNEGSWEQIGDDIVAEEVDDDFGYSLSLSSDGSIIAIGAPKNNGTSWDEGHVRVFKNNNSVWEQIGDDIDGKTRGDRSAQSVSLSSDGNLLAIGTPFSDENADDSGRVRIYKNNGGVWVQIGEELLGSYELNFFGSSVSLNTEGNYLAVGGPDYGFGSIKVYNIQESLSIRDNNLNNQISFYPNPASKQITLELNYLALKEVSIYNNLGQLIKVSDKQTINTSNLSKGIYIVQVETNLGKTTKKLIIK